MRRAIFVALLVGLAATPVVWAADPVPSSLPPNRLEEGRPFIRAYSPLEIGGGSQTWCILQDRRGVMFFGTNGAVLQYDGANWRRFPIAAAAGNSIRTLTEDPQGRIWVGSNGTFGYLEATSDGGFKYIAVSDKLPKGTPAFTDVWRTFVLPDGMFFQAQNEIFIWSHDTFTVIPAASRFGRAQQVDGFVYVNTPEAGLNILEGGALKPLPGTERLGNEAFPVLLRYDDKHLLVGTRKDGLFLYDGAAMTPFVTDAAAVIESTQVYRGLILPGPTIALETTSAGLLMLDHSGHRILTVSRQNGLPSDTVYYALRDREGALWLGLDAGVARVDTPSPVTYFNQADGLGAGVQIASRIDGRLLVGLQSGGGVSGAGLAGRQDGRAFRTAERGRDAVLVVHEDDRSGAAQP